MKLEFITRKIEICFCNFMMEHVRDVICSHGIIMQMEKYRAWLCDYCYPETLKHSLKESFCLFIFRNWMAINYMNFFFVIVICMF